jgi:pyridoxine 5-phosphate synthase
VTDAAIEKALNELRDARDIAVAAGLIVHAGHGLTYRNIGPVAKIEGLCEFNIGHSIVSRAVIVGMRKAVAEMRRLIELNQ